jgi:hypothetical protein
VDDFDYDNNDDGDDKIIEILEEMSNRGVCA